jgi:hypothetical protein
MFWDRLCTLVLVVGIFVGTWIVGNVHSQTPGTFIEGNVLTAAQLNAAFATKTDYLPGVTIGGTAFAGYVPIATSTSSAVWGTTFPALMNFSLGMTTTLLNNIPMTPSSGISAEVFGEFRFEDNGYLGVQLAIISNQGTGYGNTLTGNMSPASGCPTPPVISVTTNSSGQIVTVNNGGVPTTVGVCDNGLSFPSTSTPWIVLSGLNAGTGAGFQLVPLAFSGVGGHCASGSTRVMATDLVGEVGPRFYLECSGGFVFGPGDGTVDTSMVRCGVGILCINGSTILNSLIADTPTPTVAAGQIGFGNTVVSPGTGTCPSGTIGGQTVVGCNVINVGGTAQNVPFF